MGHYFVYVIYIHTEEPTIQYMSEDQILVVPPNPSEPITQQFTCNATGAPNFEIVWTHKDRMIQGNSEKYSENASTSTSLMAVHSVLTIKDPGLVDSGPVTCEARISYRQGSADSANEGSFVTTSVTSRSNLVVLGELYTINLYTF